ncbi:hypothetical protein BD770DRAFT_382640 [Pilaira anomala]|nr:hypothetical protein BD770DRAFT_382640 [Pilaira anomala]
MLDSLIHVYNGFQVFYVILLLILIVKVQWDTQVTCIFVIILISSKIVILYSLL